ncbi:hypothetical protein J2S19_004467 [Metabacillus malikii]|uniref:Transposase n=1 Tax=Metabacillus malikii TaxID=1504265 RepID=A0ABT9ZLF5_9BACI|nr:hypothetical protein [Metabacillus malikii]
MARILVNKLDQLPDANHMIYFGRYNNWLIEEMH